MTDDAIRAPHAQEVAATRLEHAAAQLVAVKAAVGGGDASQAHLRAARRGLLQAAVAYAVALGYRLP